MQSIDSCAIGLGDGRIKDVKFADSYTLLVLWESNGEFYSTANAIWHISNEV